MKAFWFTLYPDTFFWIKKEEGLVYNSKNFKSISFKLNGQIKPLCDKMAQTINLNSINISIEEYEEYEIHIWLKSLIEIEAGYLSEVNTLPKPISLIPQIKIQDNKEYYQFENNNGIGGSIINNVHEVTFYFNGSKNGHDEYYRQTLYPIKDCQTLNFNLVFRFIEGCRNPFLQTINFVGNPFTIPNWDLIVKKICKLDVNVKIYMCAEDLIENIQQLKKIDWNGKITLIALFDQSSFKLFNAFNNSDVNVPIIKIACIFSENDYSYILDMIKINPEKNNAQIIPLFNGENIDFFKSYVFLDKNEVKRFKLTKRHIFIRQVLNVHDFGKITVLPSNKVYTNVNENSLGTIENTPYSVTYNEFVMGKSWFNIRKQKPCDECIYQWLCPSPSNYEREIGKPNLCHVKV